MLGKTISHYRVLKVLGEGGMGVVYGRNIRLGRHVAAKFVDPEDAGPAGDRRAIQARGARSFPLNHPNICTIHDIDEGEGDSFIAMELLEGTTWGP